MSTILRESLEKIERGILAGDEAGETLVAIRDAIAALSSEGQEREGPHDLIAAAVCGLDVIRRKFKGEDELDELHGFIQEIAAAVLAAPSLPSVVGKEQGQSEASRYVARLEWEEPSSKTNYVWIAKTILGKSAPKSIFHTGEIDSMSTILTEALEPFAKAAALYEFDPKKGDRDWGQYEDDTLVGLGDITVGDLRRARAALSSEGQEREVPSTQASPSLGKEQGQSEASRYVVVPRVADYGLIEAMHDTRDWEAEDYTNAQLAYAMRLDPIITALNTQRSDLPVGSSSFPEEALQEADGGHPNPAPPQESGEPTLYQLGNILRGFSTDKFDTDEEAWTVLSKRFDLAFPSRRGRTVELWKLIRHTKTEGTGDEAAPSPSRSSEERPA